MRRDPLTFKPCPDGRPERGLAQSADAMLATLGLPRGSLLHLDRRRRPPNDDVALADHRPRDRTSRTLRRFRLAAGVVSLARIDGQNGSVIGPRHEVGTLSVVDDHAVPLDSA